MSDDVESANAAGQADDRPPGWRLTRRAFLAGCAAVAGTAAVAGKIVDDTFLGGLQPAAAAAPTVPEQLVRTGHSNNCDGACGHLVHVADGKVKLVEGGPYDTTTIDGTPIPQSYPPRICLRGVSQLENLYSDDRIKYPYKRVGERGSGQWQRITWDEAATMVAENLQKVQTKYGKDAVWIAPYTGSLSLLEGVVGVGFRFASTIGAVAGDFEGDNEGDSSTPAGWNYVLVDPTNPSNGGGFFDGHESTDFLSSKVIVLWGNNVAETSIPDWRVMKDAQAQGATIVSIDPRFTAIVGRFGRVAAHPAGHRRRPGRRRDELHHPAEALRLSLPAEVHGGAVPGEPEDQEVAAHEGRGSRRRRLRGRHRRRQGRGGQGRPQPAAARHLHGRRHAGADRAAGAGRRRRQVHARVHRIGRRYPGRRHPRPGQALGHDPPGRHPRRVRPLPLVSRRSDHAGDAHPAGPDRQHRRARRRRHHLCRRAHDPGLRPALVVGSRRHHPVHGHGADAGLRRHAQQQAPPAARRLVHGRQLRPADVGPQHGHQGAQVARLPGRDRLRHVGDRRPGRRRAARLHLHGKDRPAVVQQLLPAVHAEHGEAVVGIEVRPRRGDAGRPEDGRRQVLRQTRPTST